MSFTSFRLKVLENMSSFYRYTVAGGVLSVAQRCFYEDNGYLVNRNLVPHEKLDVCRSHFLDICNGKVDSSMMNIMKDQYLRQCEGVKGEYVINKIQEFLYDDIFFENYASHENIMEIVKSIIGPNVTAWHSMLINKPPHNREDTSRHPLHQDLHYVPFRPADRIVASWTAMERIDVTNGCLFVVPGSHKKGILYQHDYPEGTVYHNAVHHEVKGFDHVPKVNLVMEKGDTVFFHPLLLHGSGPNKSNGFRKAISVHYACSNADFIDVRGTTQENVAEEMVALKRKQKGINLSFNDMWKMNARLVCGDPGQFQILSCHL